MKFLVLFLLSGVAYADDTKEDEPKVIYKERTEIDFEGVEIAGRTCEAPRLFSYRTKKSKIQPND